MRRLDATHRGGCHYCRRPMVRGSGPGTPQNPRSRTLQHVIPRRLGGITTPENLRWCCAECNAYLASAGDCPGALAALLSFAPRDLEWNALTGWLRRKMGAVIPQGEPGEGARRRRDEAWRQRDAEVALAWRRVVARQGQSL